MKKESKEEKKGGREGGREKEKTHFFSVCNIWETEFR